MDTRLFTDWLFDTTLPIDLPTAEMPEKGPLLVERLFVMVLDLELFKVIPPAP